jgi:hypothetical protein
LLCCYCHYDKTIEDNKYYRSIVYRDENIKYYIRTKKILKCPNCDKVITQKAKYCFECANKNKRKVKIRPTKEVLLEQINEHGYTGTGRIHGVSDNFIRKWIKQSKTT